MPPALGLEAKNNNRKKQNPKVLFIFGKKVKL